MENEALLIPSGGIRIVKVADTALGRSHSQLGEGNVSPAWPEARAVCRLRPIITQRSPFK